MFDLHLPSSEGLAARERILRTAHDLFYRDGIRATGIDRIIREAGVTKVTFYRHFPSKNALVVAYLDDRHRRWMAWFSDALARQTPAPDFPLSPLVDALRAWFAAESYRGCAFINGVVELEGDVPEISDISRRHKQEMVARIATLLPNADPDLAEAAGIAVDGAIVRAQMDRSPDTALAALDALLRALLRA